MAGERSVSVPESVIEDIAYLKAGHAELRRAVDDGNVAMRNAIAALDGRIATVVGMLQEVAKLQAQHESHRDGLGRAFEEIRATDKTIADHVEEESLWRKGHEAENGATERKLSLWQGVAFGITLTIGFASGIAIWAGNLLIENIRRDVMENRAMIQAHDKRLDSLEQDAIRHHDKPQ